MTLSTYAWCVTSKIIVYRCVTSKIIVYNWGSIPTLLSAIATFFSAIVSLYLGLHRTKKPHIKFELLKKKDNSMAILATNYSSQYVRLIAIKEKNLKFGTVFVFSLRNKLEMNHINLNPIEEKKKDVFWPQVIFGKDPVAKVVFRDNVSNRNFRIYFAYIDDDWKIVSFRKYWVNKINYWVKKKRTRDYRAQLVEKLLNM